MWIPPEGARKQARWVGRRMWMHGVVAVSVCFLVSSGAQAALITFALSIEISEATPPEGPIPWMVATFDDDDDQGSVDLRLEATNLVDNEFAFEWLFNLDPDLESELTSLVFTEVEGSRIGEFLGPWIYTSADAFQADGDGLFDIQFAFSTHFAASRRFGAGEAVEYTITGIPTLTAASFDFPSAMGGEEGVYPTAAHVGGIGPDDDLSGWISVPDPATLSILGIGGLALFRRKRR